RPARSYAWKGSRPRPRRFARPTQTPTSRFSPRWRVRRVRPSALSQAPANRRYHRKLCVTAGMQLMKIRTHMRHFSLALVLCAFAACTAAQGPSPKEYQPEVGQAGKDVVWVPMPEEQVEKMLDMGKVTPSD